MSLELTKICKYFGNKKIIDNFSKNFQYSKIYGLTGKNGCGKTTLLKIIANLIIEDSGIIKTDKKTRFSYIDSNPRSFYQRLTAFENLKFYGSLNGFKEQEIREYSTKFKYFGVKDYMDKPVNKLSLGQSQILSLMRGFLNEPNIILYDETLSSLDAENKRNLIDLVTKNSFKESKVQIFTSHSKARLQTFCDEIFQL